MLEPRFALRIKEKKRLLDSLRPFPPAILSRLREQVMVEWTYNSNAIEGNTLNLRETRLVIEEGVTIGGKSVREHFEAINHKQAVEFLEELIQRHEPLSVYVIRQLHALILKGIDDKEAGKYRTTQVRIAGATHLPPDPSQVPALMEEYGRWLKESDSKLDPVVFAALAHFKLVTIHPFVDGNGRTARLLMNLILMRAGYPPAIVLKADRRGYFRLLEQAQRSNLGPFVNFIGRTLLRSLTIYLESLQPAAKPEEVRERKFIPLSEAAKFTPYSQEYLSLLARKGRLETVKIKRNWMTTRKAVEDYLESVGRGG